MTLPLLTGSFWMPEQASTYSDEVDRLFYAILIISLVMFFLILGLMLWFVFRYRYKSEPTEKTAPSHSTALELTWTVIPSLAVLGIFYFGFRSYLDMATPPANTYEINVTAYKWGWSFQYPNGHVDENLHVPAGRPVSLVLTSQDVIHSLFIPAFRAKKDCVPGRYNKLWFEAEEGEYTLFCTEYCGTKHSDMIAKVIAHDPTRFRAWLERASNWVESMPPADAGKRLYTARGCSQCHSTDGAGGIGPTFKDLYGSEHALTTGEQIKVDENYIRNSILYPGQQIAAGYENVMPTYQGRLKDIEITALIEFIKSPGPPAPAPPAADSESQP